MEKWQQNQFYTKIKRTENSHRQTITMYSIISSIYRQITDKDLDRKSVANR